MSEYPKSLRAISLINPFAWEICTGLKPLEFRRWDTKVRGRVLIHASGSRAYERDFAEYYPDIPKETIVSMRMSIIGFATIIDSFWSEQDGCYAHRMANQGLFLKAFPTLEL